MKQTKTFLSISTNRKPALLFVKVNETETGAAFVECGTHSDITNEAVVLMTHEEPNFQTSCQSWSDWAEAGISEAHEKIKESPISKLQRELAELELLFSRTAGYPIYRTDTIWKDIERAREIEKILKSLGVTK